MKIVVDLQDKREKIEKELNDRGFITTENTFKSIWIENINTIVYSGKSITLENKKDYRNYEIYLDDIKYMEIHGDE